MLNNYSIVSSWGSTFSILFMLSVACLLGYLIAWWFYRRRMQSRFSFFKDKMSDFESRFQNLDGLEANLNGKLSSYDNEIQTLHKGHKAHSLSLGELNPLTSKFSEFQSHFSGIKNLIDNKANKEDINTTDYDKKITELNSMIAALKSSKLEKADLESFKKTLPAPKDFSADVTSLKSLINDKVNKSDIKTTDYDKKIAELNDVIAGLKSSKLEKSDLDRFKSSLPVAKDYGSDILNLKNMMNEKVNKTDINSTDYDKKIAELNTVIIGLKQSKLEKSDLENFKNSFPASKDYSSDIMALNSFKSQSQSKLNHFDSEFQNYANLRKQLAELEAHNRNLKLQIDRAHEDNNTQDERIKALESIEVPVVASAPPAVALVELDADGIPKNTIVDQLSIKNVQVDPNRLDDLKRIKGIGPFIEKKVHALGIKTFEQISYLTSEDVDKVTDAIKFFPGRIVRDNWIDQAKVLKLEDRVS